MEENPKTKTLKELRDQANLTQQELAAKLQKSLSTIQCWERRTKLPRLDHAVELARVLNVDVSVVAEAFGLTK